jgi:hypothetical protein
MRKFAVTAIAAMLGACWFAAAAEAAPSASHAAIKAENSFETVTAHHKRAQRHVVRQGGGEITSFSSSSSGGAGVNHPPKK